MLLVPAMLAAMLTPQAPPAAFDAASIRPALQPFTSLKTDPGRVTVKGATLAYLIQQAYGLSSLQIAKAPDLGRFDIDATVAGTHTRAEMLTMLQTLLAERFKLAVHREMREMPVTALVVAKGAWQGQPAASPDGDPSVTLHGDPSGGKVRLVYFEGQSVTVPFLANYISPRYERVVIDQTGLTGAFDFHVPVPIDAERVADPSVPEREVAGELVKDFIDRLGLKAESRRALVEILVVDRAEQPSGN